MMSKKSGDYQQENGLDKKERKDAARRTDARAAVVCAAIRREGEEELDRGTSALIWFGVAAGLSMGSSFLTEAMLSYHMGCDLSSLQGRVTQKRHLCE